MPFEAPSSTFTAKQLDVLNNQVQGLNANLTTLGGLTPTTDNFIQAKASAWASRTPAQAMADLAVAFASVGHLSFPASQIASAGANVLDDYEEGSWTPVVSFGTPGTSSFVYGAQLGRYTKIGDLVFISCDLTVTPTIGTGSGNVQITGIPFALGANNVSGFALYDMSGTWTWPAARTQVEAVLIGSTIFPAGFGSAQSRTAFDASSMTNGNAHTIAFAGGYKI